MERITNLLSILISKKALSSFVALVIILSFIVLTPVLLVVLAVLILVYGIMFSHMKKRVMLRGNYILYLAPMTYTLNVYIHTNSISNEYIISAITSLIVIIFFSLHEPLNKKLLDRKVVTVGAGNIDEKKEISILFPEFNKIWHSIFLIAIVINLYNPIASTVAFAILALLIVAHSMYVLKIRKHPSFLDDIAVKSIEEFKPKYLVMFSGGQDGTDNYMMWDKYFKMVGEKFMVITPQKKHLVSLRKETDVPIIYYNGAKEIERILGIESIRAVFYVVNTPSNMLSLASLQPLHVFIGHGDSDKAASYRLYSAMYDKIFVSGQAAIDRYEKHGVIIPPNKFMKVGRPQVSDIEQVSRGRVRTVLYAPTWQGNMAQMDYTSLYRGRKIIQQLLERELRVVFRPHPHSRTSPVLSKAIEDIYDLLRNDNLKNGRDHIFGERAEKKMSVFDCANESDMLISDVSSVTSDYVYSEKPIVLIAMKEQPDNFVESNPVARTAYVVDNKLDGFSDIIDNLINNHDNMRRLRSKLKKEYLGETPLDGEYTDLFIEGVKEVLTMHNSHRE